MKNFRGSIPLFVLMLPGALAGGALHAQMVSPSIDRAGEPFSYFSRPTDEIGMIYA